MRPARAVDKADDGIEPKLSNSVVSTAPTKRCDRRAACSSIRQREKRRTGDAEKVWPLIVGSPFASPAIEAQL